DGDAGLGETRAPVRLHQPRRNFQQGGFARAIAPHQADAVAFAQAEFRAIQQARAAKGDGDILEMQYGRHSLLCAAPRSPDQAKNRDDQRLREVIMTPGRETILMVASGRSVRALPSKSSTRISRSTEHCTKSRLPSSLHTTPWQAWPIWPSVTWVSLPPSRRKMTSLPNTEL